MTHAATLAQAYWPGSSLVRPALLAIGGSLALWASAKIQIPFWPVPMTMQPLVVLLIGAAFGWRLGAATVLLYLAEGAMGLPVFAGTPEKGIGLAYMAGPTGGYLAGFVAAAALTGWLAERGLDRRIWTTFLAMVAGLVVIYAFGLAWLGQFLGYGEKLIAAGLAPFLYGDLAKAALGAAILPAAWALVRR